MKVLLFKKNQQIAFVTKIQDTLKDDCSFIAIEEDSGDIKGIRINRIGHRCGKYAKTDKFGVEMRSVATVSFQGRLLFSSIEKKLNRPTSLEIN